MTGTLDTFIGFDPEGERVIYIGADMPDLKHGEAGVAWAEPGVFDPDSANYLYFTFYPDNDGVGIRVHGRDLELEI